MLKRILIILAVVLIIAPITLIGVLLYTDAGTTIVAGQLDRLQRLGVRIEGMSGSLSGPLHIKRFELERPNVHIVAHDIVIYMQFRELLLQTLRVSSLTARDTVVEIRRAQMPPPVKPLRFLPSFLRIDARGIDLTRVRYVNINGAVIDADRLRARTRITPRDLRVREIQVDAPQFNLAGDLRLRAQRPLALQLTANGRMRMQRGTEVAGNAQLGGTLDELRIKTDIQSPNVASADVTFTRPNNRWRIAGIVTSPDFSLAPWLQKPPFSLRDVELEVDATAEQIHAAGTLVVPEYDLRDLTLDAKGRFAARVLQLDSADVAIDGTAARMHASGSIAFDGEAPTLDVAAHWTDLQWPLHGDAVAASPKGEVTLRGPLPYDYQLAGGIVVPRVMSGDVSSKGALSKEQLTISDYVLHTLDGSIAGTGSLQLQEPRAWSITARARDIDPVHINREFPGQLSFALDGRGQGLNKAASFKAQLADLTGTLRGERMRGSGSFQRNGNNWRAENVRLALGSAQLSLTGSLSDKIEAQWSLQAESLKTALPQAQGKISFVGTASGSLATPRVVADLQASDLGYDEWRVAQLSFDGDVDLAGSKQSRLSLQAQRVGREEVLFDSLQLDGSGNAAEHTLDLTITGTPSPTKSAPRAEMHVVGHYLQKAWNAVVTATSIEMSTKERIAIAAPANVLVARDRASLDNLCFAMGNGQFCAGGKWQRNGAWEGTVSGYELPLATLLPSGGEETEYSGRIEGRIRAFGSPGQPWQGEAGLRIIDAAIIYRPQGAEPETLNLGTGGVAATATTELLEMSFGIQAFTDTFLYANGRIERNGSNDLLHLPLTGDMRMRAADANILPIIFPEIDHAAGLLTANADIRGTLAQPEIAGRVELANGEFDSYRINLALREINLVAHLVSDSMDFKGTARAGDGRLDVGGRFTWQGGESRGEIQLRGQNLLVADLPEYRVVASPDMKFQIDGRLIKATGELAIPSARIQPVNLAGAVQPSEDARYIGEHPAEKAGRFVVDSNIRIRMGEDVQIDAFGLQGRIAGGVETFVRTNEQPIGRGELSVVEGRYEAYGQKLQISRGRLLFETSPLDDPALDIEARRKIETIEVGMNVRGTLRQPRLNFFSDPPMPQTQIVSYLLVGKPIDSMQSGDAATVGSASDALALQGGGFLASRLGRRLGLEEVGVESTRDTAGQTNTALVLGKFLSPRLFISYGISLTESINTLKLRYTISDKWILKTEAGEEQSVDVEYTIQR